MTFTDRLIALLVLLVLPLSSALAQDGPVLHAHAPPQAAQTTRANGPIHITDNPAYFPRHDEALRSYHELKATGARVLRKGASACAIGSEAQFHVRTDILVPDSFEWETLTFVCRATSVAANLWVSADLTGTFSDADMQQLESYFLYETPEDSYRPDHGIIENDNDTFGSPPDYVDSDGQVDVLLHDIKEGDGMGCCVLGYVTSADLQANPEPGKGNAANVLYVDLPDGMTHGGVDGIAGTSAHEYQHLIHYEYAPPGTELSFVNEGMSEWAEVVNGFFLRDINYLSNTAEHGTRLYTWRSGQGTGVVDRDYQRAGLFTTYIADRIGRAKTGSIVRAVCAPPATCAPGSPAVGSDGYETVLAQEGLTLAQIITDFNTANFVNDLTLGNGYGYLMAQRQNVKAVSTEITDTQTEAAPKVHNVSIQHGAFRYITWTNVEDLHLAIADKAGAGMFNRGRGTLRLVTETNGGTKAVVPLDPDETSVDVPGLYKRVTLIVSHVRPSDPNAGSPTPNLQLDITASWAGEASFASESVAYEAGIYGNGPFYELDSSDDMQATAFDVPDNAVLASVSVAPIFLNEFGEQYAPPDLPRDFKLKLWADDGTGNPGEEIFSTSLESDRTTHRQSSSYSFQEIELDLDQPELQNLSGRVFIGLANEGTDENILVLGVAAKTTGTASSYVFEDGAWTALADARDDLTASDVLPIRAKFLIPTATEDDTNELPQAITLDQNYPNPFNPATTIAYSLPRAMRVRLAVYNVLGQCVAILADGVESAGDHEARLDATGWASGVYVFALETDTQTQSRRMVVLK